jgi:hypothetical protein
VLANLTSKLRALIRELFPNAGMRKNVADEEVASFHTSDLFLHGNNVHHPVFSINLDRDGIKAFAF